MHVGVAVLAWTAAQMIVSEPLFKEHFAASRASALALYAVVFAGVFGLGLAAHRRTAAAT